MSDAPLTTDDLMLALRRAVPNVIVTWTAWDGDCRGNDGGYIIDCDTCEANYTPAQARKLIRERAKRRRMDRAIGGAG